MFIVKEIMFNEVPLSIETGRMAKQANGSCLVTYGETTVFAAVVMSNEDKDDCDFFPLMVDYREKTYAAGRIPGGVFKREAKPTTKEVLSARITDRTIRPMFPENMKREVIVYLWVVSADKKYDADVLGVVAASLALSISDIPFDEPVACVRVARINGNFVANPSFEQMEQSDMEVVVSGSQSSILMVEGDGKEISEDDMVDALRFGHEKIREIINLQNEIVAQVSAKKVEIKPAEENDEIKKMVMESGYDRAREIILKKLDKQSFETEFSKLHADVTEKVLENFPEREALIKKYIKDLDRDAIKSLVFEKNFRVDGRKSDEIRPITCEIDVLRRAHGSALFTRGQTQALATTTLGTKNDEVMDFYLEGNTYSNYMLHYNFPGFSTGETKPDRGPGRREIGHGNLAQRSLKPILPKGDEFPYTVRIVSDILESNGSSSMASVCGGSLSLMAAGVPIKKHVSGIAMGMIHDKDSHAILTDIQGIEDHLGEMDFKITGTRDGITAFQMDIKIKGLSDDLMRKALEQAKVARLKILDIMEEALPSPKEMKDYAPKIVSIMIPEDKIRYVVGPGGKTVKAIQAATKTTVIIDSDDQPGKVQVIGESRADVDNAIAMIKDEVAEPEVGITYKGKIVKILEVGAIVEFLNGKASGMVHVSELADCFVKDVSQHCRVGDDIMVKVLAVDSQSGKVKLSKRQAQQD